MARSLGDILRRFRPAVTPGPAAPSGVPVDRAAEAEAELAPVFAALAPAVAEARRILDDAQAGADRRRRAAAETVQETLAAGRAGLEAERADAASRRLGDATTDRAAFETAAAAEAVRVTTAAEDRLAGLVAAVIDAVWATAGINGGA